MLFIGISFIGTVTASLQVIIFSFIGESLEHTEKLQCFWKCLVQQIYRFKQINEQFPRYPFPFQCIYPTLFSRVFQQDYQSVQPYFLLCSSLLPKLICKKGGLLPCLYYKARQTRFIYCFASATFLFCMRAGAHYSLFIISTCYIHLANPWWYGQYKWVYHCLEGDNDSWGGRSQRKQALMQNNKSSLTGLMWTSEIKPQIHPSNSFQPVFLRIWSNPEASSLLGDPEHAIWRDGEIRCTLRQEVVLNELAQ